MANKNEANVEKHGLDFKDVAEVFNGWMLTDRDTRYEYGEKRWIGLGLLGYEVVFLVYTYRDENTIRIISMRSALRHEKYRYEEFLRNRLGAD